MKNLFKFILNFLPRPFLIRLSFTVRPFLAFFLKGDTYTEDLGQLDSDGDGATNDQEFAAGTNPGDPASKP